MKIIKYKNNNFCKIIIKDLVLAKIWQMKVLKIYKYKIIFFVKEDCICHKIV
jgi:hypothetical protein